MLIIKRQFQKKRDCEECSDFDLDDCEFYSNALCNKANCPVDQTQRCCMVCDSQETCGQACQEKMEVMRNMDKTLEMKRDLAGQVKGLRTFLDGITDAKRAMTDEEKTKADGMERSIAELQDQIQRQERASALAASIPTPPAASVRTQPIDAPTVITQRAQDLEPGIRMARFIKSAIIGMREGQSTEVVAQRMYKDDTVLHQSFRAMGTAAPSDGGVFVPEMLSMEIIPLLRVQGVVRSLGARIIPVPSGNLSIPRQTGAANFQWVGQNRPILSSKVPLGMLKLSAKKLAGLIPAANELIRDGSISADRFIRDELVNGIAESEDITAVYGKGTSEEPIGVLNTPGITTSAMASLADSDKLAVIVGDIMSQKFPSMANFGWMFHGILWSTFYNLKDGVGNYIHRAEMNLGKLFGYQFKVNNNIVVGTDSHAMTEIYFGDWGQFIIGETMGLEIAVSQEASYMDGATLVSAFGNDQTVMRALIREDFGVRYAKAFSVRTGVWTK